MSKEETRKDEKKKVEKKRIERGRDKKEELKKAGKEEKIEYRYWKKKKGNRTIKEVIKFNKQNEENITD